MEMLSRCSLVFVMCLNILVEGAPYNRKRCPIATFPVQKEIKELDCKYGESVDECGHKQCMKGPGEFCGGVNNVYGVCAPGMECSDCNRCRGCSLQTLKCFEDECLKILYRYYGKLG